MAQENTCENGFRFERCFQQLQRLQSDGVGVYEVRTNFIKQKMA